MTVLFGSYATASSRAPPHAHEDTEESLNRLFEDEAANVQDHLGDKMVSDILLWVCSISSERKSRLNLELFYGNVHD